MRLESIWQINNFNVAIASHTLHVFHWRPSELQELGRKSGVPNYGQSVDRAIQPLGDSSLWLGRKWHIRMMIQSNVIHDETPLYSDWVMRKELPWIPLSHCDQPTVPSSYANSGRPRFVKSGIVLTQVTETTRRKKYWLQFLAHEIWIFTSKTTAPHPLPTSETMQTGAATKIAESFEWRKDVLGTDS